jgi:hypothetical protein
MDGRAQSVGAERSEEQRPASRDILILFAWSTFLGILFLALLGDGRALVLDNGAHNLPLTSESFRQWSRGALPFWNPWLWSGSPLLDDPQAQVFYPLQMLSFLLAGESTWMVPRIAGAMHIAVASLGMSLLARSLGASLPGAMVAGASFASAPYFIRYVLAFGNMAAAVSWLPWCGLFLTRVLQARNWAMPFFFGSCFAALAWMGGHPQTYVQSAVVLGLLGLIAPCRSVYRRFWVAPCLVLTGLLLSAYQVIPFLELLSASHRAGATAEFGYASSVFPLSQLIFLGLPSSGGVGRLVSPSILLHFGAVTVFLSFVALIRPDRIRLGLAAVALLGLLLTNTNEVSLSKFLAGLPIFSMLRAVERWLLLTGFALSLLAGFGLTQLLDRSLRSIRWLMGGWLATLFFVGLIVGLPLRDPPFALIWGGGLLGLLAVLVPASEAKRRSGLTTVLVALTVLGPVITLEIEGKSAGNRTRFLALASAPPPNFADIAAGRTLVAVERNWTPEQRDNHQSAPWDLGMALGAFWQVPMASGYSGLLEPFYSRAIRVVAGGVPWGFNPSRFLSEINAVPDVLSIRRVVVGADQIKGTTAAGHQESSSQLKDLPRIRDTAKLNSHGSASVVIENPRAAPRIRTVGEIQYEPDRAAALSATRRSGESTSTTGILEGAPAPSLVKNCELRNVKMTAGSFRLDADCPDGPGFLVVSERWAKGWRAWRNGVPAPVERVYGLVIGIHLEQDSQSVEIRFVSPGFYTGAWIAVLTFLGLIAACRRKASSEV